MISKTSSDANWWRQAVVYQIYPRSFSDANGDGIGDLEGITAKVPYLAALGIDAVWLSPFYPSPLLDGGYDVADYRDVDPRIGTLAEFDTMMAAFKQENIKVIVDIVPNHTSHDHEWFKAAIQSKPGSMERDRYIFRDGLGPNKDQPPTDWQSIFGGNAWSPSGQNDGQFYYHMFDSSQPDLNWDKDEIKEDFKKTLRFWGDRGVAGFRIDVAHALTKDLSGELPNWEQMVIMSKKKGENGNADLKHPTDDRDEVHEIYREWRKVFNEYDPPLTAVAECWVAPDRKHLYSAADGLGQAFSFDMLTCNFSAAEFKECISFSLESAAEGTGQTWVLSNHDVIRHASRYGMPNFVSKNHKEMWIEAVAWLKNGFEGLDKESGLRRARAATMMLFGLPGSTYIYQGEELGLYESTDISDSQRQDPSYFRTKNAKVHEIGRDGCRVPLPWEAEAPNFGFGSGKEPHLPQTSWMKEHSVDLLDKRPDSTLNLYRKALNLRKTLQTAERLEWVETGNEEVLHFKRPGGWEVVLNGGKKAVPMPKGKVLLRSGGTSDTEIEGESCVWLQN